ncbi:hypothetical protein EDB83DRAFT_2677075 [Lactarius deliciosus]|nr:hypothetical protein EDB83DRAFT_2677075 [Lactarius deliciosus]
MRCRFSMVQLRVSVGAALRVSFDLEPHAIPHELSSCISPSRLLHDRHHVCTLIVLTTGGLSFRKKNRSIQCQWLCQYHIILRRIRICCLRLILCIIGIDLICIVVCFIVVSISLV